MKVNLSKSTKSIERSVDSQLESRSQRAAEASPVSANNIGYCMKCKTKVSVPNGIIKLNAKNARTLQGNCGICNTKVFAILPKLK